MAPNKRKKKSANSTRGFATTSTPAKSKIAEELGNDGVRETALLGSDVVVNAENGAGLISPTGAGEELHKISPEELENHLELSALQILFEKYGERSKKDVSRKINKLKTEQRVLRLQSEPLSTSSWLPEETIQSIFSLIESQETSRNVDLAPDVRKTENNIMEDESIIRIWTLWHALIHLGFKADRVRSAVISSLHKVQATRSFPSITSKDAIWGLEESLDVLARTCELEELPSYETQSSKIKGKKNSNNQTADPDLLEINPPTSRPPSSSGSTIPLSSSIPPESNQKSVVSDGETGSYSERDPDDYMVKYLSLQSRIYQIQPECAQVRHRSLKKHKDVPINAEIARLLEQVREIESDILFDRNEGLLKWAEMRNQFAEEAAERRKFHLDESPRLKEETVILPSSEIGDLADTSQHLDSMDMLGDFFSRLPETSINADTGATQMINKTAEGENIMIRDFGRWTGQSPRRIFEEACKARNRDCNIIYKLISESHFSNRHSLLVRWSCKQGLPSSLMNTSVSCEATGNALRVSMASISTPTVQQSEAYVSTVALFLLFGEEKTYLRLPSVWRDLWAEMSALKKHQTDAVDLEVLREIRSLVSEHGHSVLGNMSVLSVDYTPVLEDKSEGVHATISEEEVSTISSKHLAQIWSSKASTPSYRAMLSSRRNLPIWNFKDELLQAVEDNQVVIVCGETGCGKSSQVPAFILENELSCGRDCKVYCTEPRRISAISLARRVSEELGEQKSDVGTSRSLVGYAIRLENKVSAQTRLVYATTGILMRMLERSDLENLLSILVLDEVHERNIESDFLLIVLRKLMLRAPRIKVVLMSATVNATKFSNYFSQATVLNVPGRTFPVETRYLEDAVEAIQSNGQEISGRVFQTEEFEDDEEVLVDSTKNIALNPDDLLNYSAKTRSVLTSLNENRIGYDFILQLLKTLATAGSYASYSKAILVFLPGIAEIRRLSDMLAGDDSFSQGWYIYPLHSTIATEEQERAFLLPPAGIRKIILATNIAETGITIPDVTCVVDTGKHKEMRFDERRQLSRLIESFISRANAKQRCGRAGRVQKGLCFHLFTKARHNKLMLDEQTPEMLRLSLQDLVLRIKICKLGGIEETLSEALDPPSSKNIRRAVDSLIDVKALTPSEDLTPLGIQLSRLPLDVFLGKLVLLGAIYQCLDAALSIAAILSSKSPFSAPMGARSQVELVKLAYKRGDSDLFTVYNAYHAWRRTCVNGGHELQFCRKNFLSSQTLSNIEDLKIQLITSLVDGGLIHLNSMEQESLNRSRFYSRRRYFFEIPKRYDANTDNDGILNSVISWSFYPKLLVRDGRGWRNVANNQSVSLHPTSVNKKVEYPPRWLSFYHIMQSSNKYYNAHETSPVDGFAIALVCGDAEFKMYSGVIIIDGNRIRFLVDNWKVMLAIKTLRNRLRQIMLQSFRNPGRQLLPAQRAWLDILRGIFSQDKTDRYGDAATGRFIVKK